MFGHFLRLFAHSCPNIVLSSYLRSEIISNYAMRYAYIFMYAMHTITQCVQIRTSFFLMYSQQIWVMRNSTGCATMCQDNIIQLISFCCNYSLQEGKRAFCKLLSYFFAMPPQVENTKFNLTYSLLITSSLSSLLVLIYIYIPFSVWIRVSTGNRRWLYTDVCS